MIITMMRLDPVCPVTIRQLNYRHHLIQELFGNLCLSQHCEYSLLLFAEPLSDADVSSGDSQPGDEEEVTPVDLDASAPPATSTPAPTTTKQAPTTTTTEKVVTTTEEPEVAERAFFDPTDLPEVEANVSSTSEKTKLKWI